MVARIKIGKSLTGAFMYNENKFEQGIASLLLAENYPVQTDRLSKHQRLNVLRKIASLNPNLTTNSVHISLNFDPFEVLPADKLIAIAKEYMAQIGFGLQPYLLYQHNDSGHPHVHIISTRVALDGSTIGVHNIGKVKSEPARKAIEKMFGLLRAEDSELRSRVVRTAYAGKIFYGQTESKNAIQGVLSAVINNYKFTSLPELNAILSLYNVKADRGSETSRTFINNGLHYKITDEKGAAVGVPIKASLFAGKPTLKFLEAQFIHNSILRAPHKSRIKNAIDFYFLKNKAHSIDSLIKALEKEGINTVLRRNDLGVLYGLTYVDHKTKCVFNGSELGKIYSANGIGERLNAAYKSSVAGTILIANAGDRSVNDLEINAAGNGFVSGLLEALIEPENSSNTIPYELSGKKKRRKKRKSK